jgi:uncharacterized protein
MKVDNSVVIAGMVVVGVLLAVGMVVNMISGYGFDNTISVDGVGVVSVVPDEVVVYLSVNTLDDSIVAAKDENAEIVKKVRSALVGLGLDEGDIETDGFSVGESYDWADDGRKFVGYEAIHSIAVKVGSDDEDLVGSIIDIAVENGAVVDYVDFELSRELENEYEAKAMKAAAEDARVKAEAISEGLGRKLGRIVSSSSGYSMPTWSTYAKNDMYSLESSVMTDIEVGEREVSASVSVVYEIG